MKCIACKSDIADGARICVQCKAHQSSWRNWLPYLGGLVALVFLIASALTYLTKNVLEVWTQINWKEEVTLLEYKSRGKGVFLNTGDGDVFLLRMEFRCSAVGIEQIKRINQIVKPDEFLLHDFGETEEDDLTPVVVYSGSVTEGKALARKLLLDVVVANESNPSLAMYRRNLGDKFVTFPAEASLVFYSSRDGRELSTSVPSIAYLVQKVENQQLREALR